MDFGSNQCPLDPIFYTIRTYLLDEVKPVNLAARLLVEEYAVLSRF